MGADIPQSFDVFLPIIDSLRRSLIHYNELNYSLKIEMSLLCLIITFISPGCSLSLFSISGPTDWLLLLLLQPL